MGLRQSGSGWCSGTVLGDESCLALAILLKKHEYLPACGLRPQTEIRLDAS